MTANGGQWRPAGAEAARDGGGGAEVVAGVSASLRGGTRHLLPALSRAKPSHHGRRGFPSARLQAGREWPQWLREPDAMAASAF